MNTIKLIAVDIDGVLLQDPTFRTRFMNKSAGIEGRERR